MNKILKKILLTVFVIQILKKKEKFTSEINIIESIDAKNMIKKNKIKTILDVRTYEERVEGHYHNSMHIPVEQIDKLSIEKIKTLKGPILIYCRTGRRAKIAAKKIANYNNSNIYLINKTYKSIL